MEATLPTAFPIRIEHRDGRGRCVVALRDLPPGTPVLVCATSDSNVFASLHWRDSTRCAHCLRIPAEAQRCSACRCVVYCDRAHQRADWPWHKTECRPLSKLFGSAAADADSETVMERISGLVLTHRMHREWQTAPVRSGRIVRAADGRSPVYVHGRDDVLGMQQERREIILRPCRDAVRAAQAAGLLDGIDAEAAAAMLASYDSNNFAIADDLLRPLANACYPAAALLNHSCAPNAVLSYSRLPGHVSGGADTHRHTASTLLTVRTLRHVTAGEELTHAYTDVAAPRDARRSHLKHVYGFDCACEWCSRVCVCDPRHDRLVPAATMASLGDMTSVILAKWSDGRSDHVVEACVLLLDLVERSVLSHDVCRHVRQCVRKTPPCCAIGRCAADDATCCKDLFTALLTEEGGLVEASADVLLEIAVAMGVQANLSAAKYPPLHLYMQRCANVLLSRALLRSDVRMATLAAFVSYACVATAYHHVPSHPMPALQLITLLDLLQSEGDRDEATHPMATSQWLNDIVREHPEFADLLNVVQARPQSVPLTPLWHSCATIMQTCFGPDADLTRYCNEQADK